jgi:nucleoid-associated protein YgaU
MALSHRHPGSAPLRALGALFVPAALAVASAVLAWAASAPIGVVRAPGAAPVDALVALGAALLCAVVLALTAVGATLTLVLAVTGRVSGSLGTVADVLTPRFVRVALCLAVGVTVVGGQVGADAAETVATSVGPAAAAGSLSSTHRRDLSRAPLPAGWSPDRPAAPRAGPDRHESGASSGPDQPARSSGPSRPAGRSPVVVVRPGDTLWALAARDLGPGASAAHVASAWPRWYAANRSTIGADADLILPGERLAVPQSRPTINREESR